MNPILDIFSIEDKTVKSCEPSLLLAVASAIKILSYKFPQDRVRIEAITVGAGEITEDGKYPGNYDRQFTVKIGFRIKKIWHWAEIVIAYHYAPNSCMGSDEKSIKIDKQVGTGKDSQLVEIFKRESKSDASHMVSILNKE